jgi:hypothetical protein
MIHFMDPKKIVSITNFNEQAELGKKPTYKPYGNVMVLDYTPPEKIGQIHVPNGIKTLTEFITCAVTAAGPGCDLVKVGDRILIATKAIMGVRHDGHEIWVTQENTILAVVE